MFSEIEVGFPQVIQWPQKLHLVKEDYHYQFEGNECFTLLCKTDVLFEIIGEAAENTENHPAIPFANAFKLMEQMVQSCFGKDLKVGWQEHITDFCQAYYS